MKSWSDEKEKSAEMQKFENMSRCGLAMSQIFKKFTEKGTWDSSRTHIGVFIKKTNENSCDPQILDAMILQRCQMQLGLECSTKIDNSDDWDTYYHTRIIPN